MPHLKKPKANFQHPLTGEANLSWHLTPMNIQCFSICKIIFWFYNLM